MTTTYSVGITIPANKSKFSKLAYYSDYNKRHVKVITHYYGPIYRNITEYTDHYAPRKDTYLQVVYQ